VIGSNDSTVIDYRELRVTTSGKPANVAGSNAGAVQVREPVDLEALLPQPTMETLHVCVWGRLAWLDMPQFDLPLQRGKTSSFKTRDWNEKA
jgi:hypothetical protein